MRSSKVFGFVVISSVTLVANAARVDFNDPKRALGREDDVRIDAQLVNDTISSSSPLTVTYQIENLGTSTVAIADKVATADYNADSQTITLSIGAEVPTGATMPHMVAIKPGETRVLTSVTHSHVVVPSIRTPWTAIPRYVEIQVTLLRDVKPFAALIEQQSTSPSPQPFPKGMFERWVEGSDSVFLNAIPIRWKDDNHGGNAETSRPAGAGGTY